MTQKGERAVAGNHSAVIYERRRRTANLYLAGKSQHEIGQELGITQQQVSKDLIVIRDEWLKFAVERYDEKMAREIAKLDRYEMLMNEAYERSCLNAETKTTSTKKVLQLVKDETDSDGGHLAKLLGKKANTKAEYVTVEINEDMVSKGQAGDPRFIREAKDCVKLRCQLLGLLEDEDSSKGNNTTNNFINIDYKEFFKHSTMEEMNSTDTALQLIANVGNVVVDDKLTNPPASSNSVENDHETET